MAVEGGAGNRTGYAERTDNGEIIQVDNIQSYSELVAHASSESDEDLAARTSLTIIRRCPISTAGMQNLSVPRLYHALKIVIFYLLQLPL